MIKKQAWQIFKYLSILYTAGFWIWLLVDDYDLIQRNGLSVLIWAYYLLLYFLYFIMFSLYYWAVVWIGNFVNNRFINKQDL